MVSPIQTPEANSATRSRGPNPHLRHRYSDGADLHFPSLTPQEAISCTTREHRPTTSTPRCHWKAGELSESVPQSTASARCAPMLDHGDCGFPPRMQRVTGDHRIAAAGEVSVRSRFPDTHPFVALGGNASGMAVHEHHLASGRRAVVTRPAEDRPFDRPCPIERSQTAQVPVSQLRRAALSVLECLWWPSVGYRVVDAGKPTAPWPLYVPDCARLGLVG